MEIYDPTGGGRVVTAIEVLSPSNKLPGRARTAYESKQRLFLSGGVNLATKTFAQSVQPQRREERGVGLFENLCASVPLWFNGSFQELN